MKVKELIEQLQSLDGDLEVIIHSDNFELRGAYIPATKVYVAGMKYKKKLEGFVDAFDHGRYSTEVYVSSDDGEDVVKIY